MLGSVSQLALSLLVSRLSSLCTQFVRFQRLDAVLELLPQFFGHLLQSHIATTRPHLWIGCAWKLRYLPLHVGAALVRHSQRWGLKPAPTLATSVKSCIILRVYMIVFARGWSIRAPTAVELSQGASACVRQEDGALWVSIIPTPRLEDQLASFFLLHPVQQYNTRAIYCTGAFFPGAPQHTPAAARTTCSRKGAKKIRKIGSQITLGTIQHCCCFEQIHLRVSNKFIKQARHPYFPPSYVTTSITRVSTAPAMLDRA